MFERFFKRDRVLERLRGSPAAAALERFVSHLAARGYSVLCVQVYVQVVEHFLRWLFRSRRTASDISRATTAEFIERHLPRCRCKRLRSRRGPNVRSALGRFLVALEVDDRGPHVSASENAEVAAILDGFEQHLERVCGAAPSTRGYYGRYARQLLETRYGRGRVDLSRLSAKDVRRFVLTHAVRSTPGTVGVVAVSIRSLLRFLLMRGLVAPGLLEAVPRVARWRLAGLPRILTESEIDAVLATFDRKTRDGRRDYAIAVCLNDLGLRACEVAPLMLSDIDWRSRTLTIRSAKTRRADVLPLPTRVAKAISDYLRRGRPPTMSRSVFVHHRAPHGRGIAASTVRGAVRRAYVRAGLGTRLGPHALRRTAATRLLRSGSSLKDVSDFRFS